MDNNLDSLLDDALADFDKPLTNNSNAASTSQQSIKKTNSGEKSNPTSFQPPNNVFEEFFSSSMSEKLQEGWNLAMKELQEEDPELAKNIKLLSNLENSSASDNTENDSKTNIDDSSGVESKVKEALESIAKSSKEDLPPDDVMNSFLNLGLDGSNAAGDGLPGFDLMEDMMKMMLSKDMLYPPMKEMINNYPEWLKKNKDKISSTDMDNYKKQLVCMEKICHEFELEKDTDSDSVKKTRFDLIMNKVNEMQQYGQPPSDLIGDQSAMSQAACLIS